MQTPDSGLRPVPHPGGDGKIRTHKHQQRQPLCPDRPSVEKPDSFVATRIRADSRQLSGGERHDAAKLAVLPVTTRPRSPSRIIHVKSCVECVHNIQKLRDLEQQLLILKRENEQFRLREDTFKRILLLQGTLFTFGGTTEVTSGVKTSHIK